MNFFENGNKEDIEVINLGNGSICLYNNHFNSITNKDEFSKKYTSFKEQLSNNGQLDSKTGWIVVPKDLLPLQSELLYHSVIHPELVQDNIDKQELKNLLFDASFKSYFSGQYNTILHLAVHYSDEESIRKNTKKTNLAYGNNFQSHIRNTIRELIAKGTPDQVFRVDDDNNTAFQWSIVKCDRGIVDLFIEKGTVKDLLISNCEAESALITAIANGKPSIAKKIMDKEGITAEDLFKKAFVGKTALHWAIERGYSDIAWDLVKVANPEQLHIEWKERSDDKLGKTALQMALEKPDEFKDIIKAIADKSTYEQLKPYRHSKNEAIVGRLSQLIDEIKNDTSVNIGYVADAISNASQKKTV